MDQDIRFDKNRGCAVNNMAYDEDALHEECGVFGMYDFDGTDVASTIYYGLLALQHRFQFFRRDIFLYMVRKEYYANLVIVLYG